MIGEYFTKLRYDPKHHLGLGDIRLTVAQQHEIEVMYNKLKVELKHEIGDWLRWCGYLEDGHRPKGLIKTSTQLLKKYTDA